MRKSCDRKLCDVIDPYIRPLQLCIALILTVESRGETSKEQTLAYSGLNQSHSFATGQLLSILKLRYSRAGQNVPLQQEKKHYPRNPGGNRRRPVSKIAVPT